METDPLKHLFFTDLGVISVSFLVLFCISTIGLILDYRTLPVIHTKSIIFMKSLNYHAFNVNYVYVNYVYVNYVDKLIINTQTSKLYLS